MASVELRHWFTLVCALISLFILSSIDLLTLPSWLLAGLIRWHLGWFSKSCLWSFRDVNADDSFIGSKRLVAGDRFHFIVDPVFDAVMSVLISLCYVLCQKFIVSGGIIKHTRKSLLFHQKRAWSKRNSDNTFDVTMGSYDRAEVCELIGLFILNTLQDRFGKDVGLYRDDGLAVINIRSGRLCDRERKELAAVFDNLGLKITAQTNQLRTNFLDLTFDLNKGSYKPYRKPNDDPL